MIFYAFDHTHYGTPFLRPMLIRQGWKASLLDVGLNKFVRVASTLRPIPKSNNT